MGNKYSKPQSEANVRCPDEPTEASTAAKGISTAGTTEVPAAAPPLCCFFLRFGVCNPPRPPCRFSHQPDDGVSPCSFGATCRTVHARRMLAPHSDVKANQEYWIKFNENGSTVGLSPAQRDASLLRSQLEPWRTPEIRNRLVRDFGEAYEELDPLGRAELMQLLLAHYQRRGPRKVIKVNGVPVRRELCDLLLVELDKWSGKHTVNNRPSISAKSYMIMQSLAEFPSPTSIKAKQAASKIHQHQKLWDLATMALAEVDASYASAFTALAVTMGFSGSPHIDKQNTGYFYGLALGDFPEGQGQLCVECNAFVVAEMNTKNRLGKVDGRFPHWVGPYDPSTTRYSLIYYQTTGGYTHPTTAVFGLPENALTP